MTEPPDFGPPDPGDATIEEQLIRAARDLWCMVLDSGTNYVVFSDRRGVPTRVAQCPNGRFSLVWEAEDDEPIAFERTFDNLREAAFHGFQGPH
jgi:hypothetical protein